MKYNKLGKTEIEVSRLCYGSLTLGPLQANLEIEEGASLIRHGYERGINFIDTAQSYQTYSYIKRALDFIPRDKYVIFTKTYAYDKKTAEEAFVQALKELGTDYIDGFMLHEQESEHTFRGHYEATEYLLKKKEQGYIRSFGISTHHIQAVKDAVKTNYIDVIHPLFNKYSLGIADGTQEEMYKAITEAYNSNIGIYSMKPLGGGNLIDSYEDSMKFVLEKNKIHSTAIGMQSKDEINANVEMLEIGNISLDLASKIRSKNRKLLISDWCTGCGNCSKRCRYGAIKIIDNIAVVDQSKCILCSYCARECKDFCIKVI